MQAFRDSKTLFCCLEVIFFCQQLFTLKSFSLSKFRFFTSIYSIVELFFCWQKSRFPASFKATKRETFYFCLLIKLLETNKKILGWYWSLTRHSPAFERFFITKIKFYSRMQFSFGLGYVNMATKWHSYVSYSLQKYLLLTFS